MENAEGENPRTKGACVAEAASGKGKDEQPDAQCPGGTVGNDGACGAEDCGKGGARGAGDRGKGGARGAEDCGKGGARGAGTDAF